MSRADVLYIETAMNLETFNRKIVPMRNGLLVRARQLTGDGDSAEDLVQEVMLRLWSVRDTLDRHTNHEALALTILRNKATDRLRRQQRERERAADTAQEWPAVEDNSTERADEMRLIGMIVDNLPPLQGRIFRMKEIEGYESDEIIKITGCTPECLRQNLSRARRRIREEFVRLTTRRKT